MWVSTDHWLRAFLGRRHLDQPDGRPIYAYRCSPGEFEEIVHGLNAESGKGLLTEWDVRAFVLYASEWWQRHYDGARWRWEPLLEFVGWEHVHYSELWEPVRRALRWWRVELVRLEAMNTYLGTFACQGGLPLALVGESSRVTSYLRGVLKHVARYRQFVDDSIELARDQQHLLRPRTLRREYVFRLAADLVDAVLDLREDVQGEEVLNVLDRERPGWRDSMPLDLDSERARELLVGLLRDAKAGTPVGGTYGLERVLVRTDVGWRLGARVQLPRSLPAETLALQLGRPESDLPLRMHVRVAGRASRVLGLYAAGGENFHLVADERRRAPTFWDEEGVAEFRLEFFAQEVVGEVAVRRGGALGELPWVFRGDGDECTLVGEGSVSDRSPELLVLMPAACRTDHGEALEVEVLGRQLWRVTAPAVVQTSSGRCSVKPMSEQVVETDYRLSGQRFYGFESAYPLFQGEPRLSVARGDEDRHRAVPGHEVGWRTAGGDWQARPDGFGLWEVRHVRQGVLRYHDRVGMLPASLKLSLVPGSSLDEGELVLDQVAGVGVAEDGLESKLSIDASSNSVRIAVKAGDPVAPPAEVAMRLRWTGSQELRVRAPFPGEGARFLRNGRPLGRVLPVDDLYGVRATALATDESQKFWVEGELRAADAVPLNAVAYFRRELRRTGLRHELALVDVNAVLRLMLGGSASADAKVVLRIRDRHDAEHAKTEVRRFTAALEHDPTMGSVLLNSAPEHDVAATFEALPLARADLEPVRLAPVGAAESPVGARLPDSLGLEDEPWLVVLRQDEGVRVEPVVVGGRAVAEIDEGRSLREALRLADAASRAEAVNRALLRLADEKDPSHDADDWAHLTDMMLCLEDVPPTSSELLNVLPQCPTVLVRCLFRLDASLRKKLWRLDDELPFSWLLIRRSIWRREAELAYADLRYQLDGVVDDPEQSASERVISILEEGATHVGALDTVSTDVAIALAKGTLSDDFERAIRETRDARVQGHINLLASEDDWPPGDGRREWSEELQHGSLLSQLEMWQFGRLERVRQPTFDTPVAAAWCCFLSDATPRTVFLVKRMRLHNPEWFDVAYRAAWYRLARETDRVRKGGLT